MWRSKKFIVAVLAAVVLVGSITGVVLAADNGEDTGAETKYEALLDRVCEIYEQETGVAIDGEVLKDAFAQAQSEIRTDAMKTWLQSLVNEGRITQDEADQYLEWWQDEPDMEPYREQLREWQQARPGIPPELEEWQKAMPDMPFNFRFGGRGGFRGIGGMRDFGGLCAP